MLFQSFLIVQELWKKLKFKNMIFLLKKWSYVYIEE